MTTISKGSHGNAEQGYCIMEYVSMIARLPFSDRPECASRAMTDYTIRLNDRMPSDEMRTKLLLPLAEKFLNTRDGKADRERVKFLALWTINKVLPLALKRWPEHAEACASAKTLIEARDAARAARKTADADAADAAATAYAAAYYAADYAADATYYAADAADAAADAATATDYAAYAADAKEEVYTIAVKGLSKALDIR